MKNNGLLQISADLNPQLGGPVIVINELAPRFNNRYQHTQAVVGKKEHTPVTSVRLKSIFGNRYGVPTVSSAAKLVRLLRSHDIVLTHGFYLGTTLFAVLLAKNKVLIMPHGSLEQYQWNKSNYRKFMFDVLFKFVAKYKDFHFIVATEQEVNSISMKFPKIKVSVVGLGVSTPQHFRIHESKSDPLKLLSFSRITKKKRIDLIILALSKVDSYQLKCNLTVAGSGDFDLLQKLQSIVIQEKLENRVNFIDWVPESEIDNLFYNVDIFLLPSENENYAVAVAQSIVRGLPVIVSDKVALSSFVSKHNCGIVINDISTQSIAAAILEVANNLKFYSNNCLDASSYLLWDNVINNWFNLLDGKIHVA